MDDDIDLCALMADFFAQHDFAIEAVHDGTRGLARALDGGYDLIILDVMLPVLDGFEMLKQIRRRSPVPVIMLTARTGAARSHRGSECGRRRLSAEAVRSGRTAGAHAGRAAALAAKQSAQAQIAEAGGVRVNSQTREVWLGGQTVELTSIEFDILDFLVRSAGRVVSRNELAAVLYQRESTPYERSLDVHISHLRKKLERSERVQIRTVRGVGYLLCGSSEAASEVDLRQNSVVVLRNADSCARCVLVHLGRSGSSHSRGRADRSNGRLRFRWPRRRRLIRRAVPPALAAYLRKAARLLRPRAFLTDARGKDLVTGADRSALAGASRRRWNVPHSVHGQFVLVAPSRDSQYRLIAMGRRPPFTRLELPAILRADPRGSGAAVLDAGDKPRFAAARARANRRPLRTRRSFRADRPAARR